jgi:large subunit ribosomal protein L9
MQVILLERIAGLGLMGDEVTVRPGYARNFLLPQKKALRATEENKKFFETQRTKLEADNLKQRDEAQKVGAKIDNAILVVIRQAGDSGQLYGSVTPKDVADECAKQQSIKISRNQVHISNPIKELGLHRVEIKLHPEVVVAVEINVAKSAEEAALQLEERYPKAKKEEATPAEDVEVEAEAESQE